MKYIQKNTNKHVINAFSSIRGTIIVQNTLKIKEKVIFNVFIRRTYLKNKQQMHDSPQFTET